MSLQLISLNSDLKRLRDEGYTIEICSGYLLISHIPYLNSKGELAYGTMASTLHLAGDRTQKPEDHVMHFVGEHPCNVDGTEIVKFKHQSQPLPIRHGLTASHSFSSKPPGGYHDYYDKVSTYAAIISSPAQAIEPEATPTPFFPVEAEASESVFCYVDTASSRSQINGLNMKAEQVKRLAIVGLGGTGSYLLDLVAKTHVGEIHLFDGDVLSQHNAFRSPGAISLDELKQGPKKVHFYRDRYASMRRQIFAHDCFIDDSNVDQLTKMDFAFICLDSGAIKKKIFLALEGAGISFIDVGMGLVLNSSKDTLTGLIRVTTSTPEHPSHLWENPLVSFADEQEDVYSSNVQTAELNALNATLAVIRWKKLLGIYSDLEHEHQSLYTLDGNLLMNSEHSHEPANPDSI